MPALMLICFIIGLFLAVVYHLYYQSLNNTVIHTKSQQTWANRIGTGLAFLIKTFLAAAVGIVCTQVLWWSLRSRSIEVSTLDSLFDLCNNILSFLNPLVWVCGYQLAILSLITWLIPIIAVFTPSALSVQSSIASTVSPMSIPSILWNAKLFAGWNGRLVNGQPMSAWASVKPNVTRVVTATAVQGSVLSLSAPAVNSSYTLNFHGPSLQCTNSTSLHHTVVEYYNEYGAEVGDPWYVIFVPSPNITEGLRQIWNSNTSTFSKLDETSTDSAKIFTFTNGIQDLETNTTVLNGVSAYTNIVVDVDHMSSKVSERLSYTSIMAAIGELLVGRANQGPLATYATLVLSTTLAETKEIMPMMQYYADLDAYPSLAHTVEAMSRNITLSLFSNSFLLQNSSQSTPVNVTTSYPQTIFVYSTVNLLVPYGAAILVTLLSVIVGLLTFTDGGLSFTGSFSTILRATRHPMFNDDRIVPIHATNGAEPLPESLAKTKVHWISPGSGASQGISRLVGSLIPAEADRRTSEREALVGGREC
ncbi:hypothetical protein BDW60DRAFT_206790 [Aspergillus nidulans var. acristatus]